jgi:hypothetical protein
MGHTSSKPSEPSLPSNHVNCANNKDNGCRLEGCAMFYNTNNSDNTKYCLQSDSYKHNDGSVCAQHIQSSGKCGNNAPSQCQTMSTNSRSKYDLFNSPNVQYTCHEGINQDLNSLGIKKNDSRADVIAAADALGGW